MSPDLWLAVNNDGEIIEDRSIGNDPDAATAPMGSAGDESPATEHQSPVGVRQEPSPESAITPSASGVGPDHPDFVLPDGTTVAERDAMADAWDAHLASQRGEAA